MTQTSSHHSRSTTRRGAALAAAAVLSLSVLLAGCSAGDSGASSGESVQQGTAGDTGSLGGAGDGAADAGTSAGSGTDAAGTTADDHRQVIQTGDVSMTVDSPQDAADAIVALTDKAGGRIDSRKEQAATGDVVATANLTIRIPASTVNATVLALRGLGSVDTIELSTQDVTSPAADLDARIAGMQLSVARMSDLLDKATTNEEIVQAEADLTQRQTSLEELQSQKAQLTEQVSLATLKIALQGHEAAPAPAQAAPPGPNSFVDGLAAGWGSFVGFLQGVATELGVLLPWLVLGGGIAWGSILLNRRYRRAHPPTPTVATPYERIPVGVGAPGGHGQPPSAPPVHYPGGE